MNALTPPFPSNPTVGEWFGNWVWNGVRWVCGPAAGVRVIVKTMTASGPYMPTSGLVTVVVELVGGGGGGGGALGAVPPAGNAEGWVCGAGGGGAGSYSRIALAASLVAGGVSVTIGAGGAGGPATVNTQGGAGGATTFGALCTANGGSGGGSNCSLSAFALDPSVGFPGLGGGPGVGEVAVWGNSGGGGANAIFDPNVANVVVRSGFGGGSFFGGSPAGIADLGNAGQGGSNGNPGNAFGAGGSGGASAANTIPATGGAGAPGVCIVTEYCWADVTDDCLTPPLEVNARVAVTHVPWPGPGPCPPGWGQGGYIESDE